MNTLEIQYIEARDGNKTAEVNGYLIHSKYNPIQEAERIIQKSYDKNKFFVLFGFGLGYLVQETQKVNPYLENLVIVDPLFGKLESNVDLPSGFDDEIISNMDSNFIETKLRLRVKHFTTDIQIICSPNYDKICANEFKQILENIKNVQTINKISENTVRRFAENWQENFMKNIAVLKNANDFNSLFRKYDCPIVIASGGPSLIKQLPKLKEVKDSIILIASGSTINTLLANDIVPDYVVSVDGGEANYNHFKNMRENSSKLIFGFTSYYKIQEEWKQDIFPILEAGEIEFQEYIKKRTDIEIPLIHAGGSVANYAFSCAIKMTTGPIVLIGQDLAYTDLKSHAESNVHFKVVDEEFKRQRGMFEIEGYYGENVLTDDVFLIMMKDFTRLYNNFKNHNEIYNCTEGGAKIQDIPQLSFDEFIESYNIKRLPINKQLVQAEKLSFNSEEILTAFKKEIQLLNQSIKQLEKVLILLKKIKPTDKFNRTLLNELDKTDKFLSELNKEVFIKQILSPIVINIMTRFKEAENESNAQKSTRVYYQNQELYNGSLVVVEKAKAILEEVMEEL